ncbi:MAG: sarcosine oxidase subunit beta family protein, partial [Rhodobacteraceae bacterium]|nr:sarcosine oxidase subunit beta family protein [Paracoccaceae bacterium]
MKYSAFEILRQGFTGNKGWRPVWRNPDPKPSYDVIIIGGGGHGLATAHYLAKKYGVTNVAVLERGYLGGGNVGRNTTIVRADYGQLGNSEFYSHSLKLWEGLSQDLNYNVMFSPRGLMELCHSDEQIAAYRRRANMIIAQGDDAEMLNREQTHAMAPYLDMDNARFPIRGCLVQRRGGTARHDAVAWGFARSADSHGVDLIQNCEVTGFDIVDGKVCGVQTSRGVIKAAKIGMAVAGRSSQVGAMAGLRLPIESHVLQAFVTEGIKPFVHHVVSFGMGHFYISQSDKGGLVFGGDLDMYNSYAQRGNLPRVEQVAEAGMSMIPALGKVRQLRSWGGIMDMSMDGSPFITKTPVDGLFFNGGWCYGGFKATPASGLAFAHLIATGTP